MKTSLLLRLLLPVALLTPTLHARNLTDHLPADSLIVIHVPHFPTYRSTFQRSPMGELWQEFDWKESLLSFSRVAIAEGELDTPLPDIQLELLKLEERGETLLDHLSGELVIVLGDITDAMSLIAEHQQRRSALWENVDWSNVNGWDESVHEENQRLEAEMDAKEQEAIAAQMYIYAEVRDPHTLTTLFTDWAREAEQEQNTDERTISFTIHDQGPHTLYSLTDTLDEEESDPDALPDADMGLWWTLTEDILVIGPAENAVRNALDHLDRRPGERLSSSPAYLDTLAFLGDAHSYVYLNLPALDPLLRIILADQDSSPGGLTPMQFADWLDLDALAPLAFGATLQDDGILTKLRYGFQRENALSRIFLEPGETPAPLPSFVHKHVGQVVTTHWSLPRFYTQLQTELRSLAPEAAAAMGMAEMFAAQALGFDFKTQFLDHLGAGFAFTQHTDRDVITQLKTPDPNDPDAMMRHIEQSMEHPTKGTYYLFAFEVTDQQAVATAINTLLGQMFPSRPPEQEDILDHPVTFPLTASHDVPENMRRFLGYTFLDNYLVLSVGDPMMIRQAVEAFREPDERLWSQPSFLEARRHIPDPSITLEYSSGREIKTSFMQIDQSMDMMRMLSEGELHLPDFSAIGGIFRHAIGGATRRGLIFENQGLSLYGDPE